MVILRREKRTEKMARLKKYNDTCFEPQQILKGNIIVEIGDFHLGANTTLIYSSKAVVHLF